MKDVDGSEVKQHKWYKLTDNDSNPWEFHRFINIIDEKDDRYICLVLWRNVNNPDLNPTIEIFPKVMLGDRLLDVSKIDWIDRVTKAYEASKSKYIEDSFERRIK